jgi:hypothetical protein
MIRIDWVQLCEMAFLDDCERLCMIGVTTRLPAPALPIAMRQLVIVVRISDVQAEETFGIGVSMVTPCGVSMTPHTVGFDIAVTPEYIFITMRDIPFAEEGVHHFAISVGKGDPVSIDVPVRLTNRVPAGGTALQKASSACAQSARVSGREVN